MLRTSKPHIKDNYNISCKIFHKDNYFDVCTAINTIHNLEIDDCKKAIREMKRVTKIEKNLFIQVDAYTNDSEKIFFEEWVLTAKTCLKPKQWEKLFKDADYQGDYFWTIIGFID